MEPIFQTPPIRSHAWFYRISLVFLLVYSLMTQAQERIPLSHSQLLQQAAAYCSARNHDQPVCDLLSQAATSFQIPELNDYIDLLCHRDLDVGYQLQQKVLSRLLQKATTLFGETSEVAIRCRRELMNATWQTDFSLALRAATKNREYAHQLFQRDTTNWHLQQLYLLCRLDELNLLNTREDGNPIRVSEVLQIEQITDSLYTLHPEDSEDKLNIYLALGGLKPTGSLFTNYLNEVYERTFPNGTRIPSSPLPNGIISNTFNYLDESLAMAQRLYGSEDLRTLELQSYIDQFKNYQQTETEVVPYIDLLKLENQLSRQLPQGDPTLLKHRLLILYLQSRDDWNTETEKMAIDYLADTKRFFESTSRPYVNALFQVIVLQYAYHPEQVQTHIQELLQICDQALDHDPVQVSLLHGALLYYMQEHDDPSILQHDLLQLCDDFLAYTQQKNPPSWNGIQAAYQLLSLCIENQVEQPIQSLYQTSLMWLQELAPTEPSLSICAHFYFATLLIQVQHYDEAEQLLLQGLSSLQVNKDINTILYSAFISEINSLYIKHLHDLDKAESFLDDQQKRLENQPSHYNSDILIHSLWERLYLIRSKTDDYTQWLPLLFLIDQEIKTLLNAVHEESKKQQCIINYYLPLFDELCSLREILERDIINVDPEEFTTEQWGKAQQQLHMYDNQLLQLDKEMTKLLEEPHNTLQIDDYQRWSILSNSSAIYLNFRKDTLKAEQLLKQGLQFDSSDLQCIVLNELVGFYALTKDYVNELRYSLELEQLLKENPYLTKRIDTQMLAFSIGSALYQLGEYERSIPYAEESYRLKQEQLQRNINLMTAEERETFIQTKGGHGNLMLKFLLPYYPERLAAEVYQSILTEKGYLLRATERIQSIIRQSDNPLLQEAWNQLNSLNHQIQYYSLYNFDLKTMSSTPNEQAWQLKEKIQQLERNLNRLVEELHIASSEQFDWKEIQNKLDTADIAIEFLFSEHHLGALLLRKGATQPHYIQLGEWQPLFDKLQACSKLDSRQMAEALYQQDELQLYARIWEPLLPALKGIRQIYFSPSGFLNSLSLSAIRCPDGSYLLDHYQMHQLTSTAELLRSHNTKASTDTTLVLYGAPYFSPDHQKEDELYQALRGASEQVFREQVQQRAATAEQFAFLPYTRREVEDIYRDIRRKGLSSRILFGAQATERSLRNFSGNSPRLIHLATHGFWVRSDTEIQHNTYLNQFPSTRGSSMMRSGIALTGANETWIHGNTEKEDDGILTAHEISRLDLHQTQLMVLSACETGIGQITEEGVYGLYRGFKQAGVASLLVSLWKVSDRSTAELMIAFYRKWLSGVPMQQAFTQAVQEIRQKYESPFYWAPFVLLDSL